MRMAPARPQRSLQLRRWRDELLVVAPAPPRAPCPVCDPWSVIAARKVVPHRHAFTLA
jgi:hypothetical protein